VGLWVIARVREWVGGCVSGKVSGVGRYVCVCVCDSFVRGSAVQPVNEQVGGWIRV
jgi:hypothetical protein